MPTITITDRNGETRSIDAEVGLSLMEAIKDAGLDEVLAMCGGNCSCATCHVYVDDSDLAVGAPDVSTPGAQERDLLETSIHTNERSRLSCQIPISVELDGLRVVIAPAD